jgi:hypothetical protein
MIRGSPFRRAGYRWVLLARLPLIAVSTLRTESAWAMETKDRVNGVKTREL